MSQTAENDRPETTCLSCGIRVPTFPAWPIGWEWRRAGWTCPMCVTSPGKGNPCADVQGRGLADYGPQGGRALAARGERPIPPERGQS